MQEGKAASLAADFSITQFRHVGRLLMVHGRSSYKRSAALGQFVMHRGLIISTMQVRGQAGAVAAAVRAARGGPVADAVPSSLQGRVLLRLLLRVRPPVPGLPHGGVSAAGGRGEGSAHWVLGRRGRCRSHAVLARERGHRPLLTLSQLCR